MKILFPFRPAREKLNQAIKLLNEQGNVQIRKVIENIAEGYDLLKTDFEQRRRNQVFHLRDLN
jgi:hypothetical protein